MARAHVHRMLRLCVALPEDLPEVQCACVQPKKHSAYYIERFYSAHFMPHIGRDPPCGGPQLLTSLLDFVFEQCTFAEGAK